MGEMTARVQQVTSSVEKAIVEQASHVEAAIGEASKLQAEGIDQAGQLADRVRGNVRDLIKVASDKIVLARKVTSEWAKQVLAATRTAGEAFTKKS